MPFCPKCEYEYQDSVKVCPECKVDLIEKMVQETSEAEYTEVYMVSNRMEADVVSSLLTEHNVGCLIRDLRLFPVLPDFGRRARLRVAVPKNQTKEAIKLLKEAVEDGALTEQGRFL